LLSSTSLVVRCSYPLRGESAISDERGATRAESSWQALKDGKLSILVIGFDCRSLVRRVLSLMTGTSERVVDSYSRRLKFWAFVWEIIYFCSARFPFMPMKDQFKKGAQVSMEGGMAGGGFKKTVVGRSDGERNRSTGGRNSVGRVTRAGNWLLLRIHDRRRYVSDHVDCPEANKQNSARSAKLTIKARR